MEEEGECKEGRKEEEQKAKYVKVYENGKV
jgi:hypothetical protein